MPRHKFKLLLIAFIAQFWVVSTVSAQPYAYVANLGSNNVSVVNTTNSSIVASVTLPFGPTGVGVTPNGSTVYVASQTANTVSAINTSSNSVITSFGVCATPTQLAVNPNGQQVIVVCEGADQVSVIDTASNSVKGTIQVGSRPSGVAFNPSGTRAYVTNLWSSNVSIIDTAGRYVVGTFSAGSGPAAVTVSRDGASVYVANEYSNNITVHDSSSGSIQNTISGISYPNSIAISPNGSRLFVTNGNSSSASVIDTGSRNVIAVCGVGLLPTAVTVSPDGTRAYVTNQFGLSVSVIDTGSNSVVNTIQGIGVYPVGVAMATLAATSAPTTTSITVAPAPAPAPAPTPTPVATNCFASIAGDHWKGEYYNNMYLSGNPIMVRDDGTDVLNFNWGYEGSPNSACNVPGTQFSVRWTRSVNFNAGTYRFSTTSDDGMRLFIDNQKVLDRWYDQLPGTQTVDVPLNGGAHTILIEYYQNRGGASAGLNWQQISTAPSTTSTSNGCIASVGGDRWRGEYFNNMNLSGSPIMVRDDGSDVLNFNWGYEGSPNSSCNVPGVMFSVRWTRSVNFNGGTYRFSTSSDDGMRLYVDGQKVLDRWYDQLPGWQSVDIQLGGGTHTLVVEYYQNRGGQMAAVNWRQL